MIDYLDLIEASKVSDEPAAAKIMDKYSKKELQEVMDTLTFIAEVGKVTWFIKFHKNVIRDTIMDEIEDD